MQGFIGFRVLGLRFAVCRNPEDLKAQGLIGKSLFLMLPLLLFFCSCRDLLAIAVGGCFGCAVAAFWVFTVNPQTCWRWVFPRKHK